MNTEPIAVDTEHAARRLGVSTSYLEKLRVYHPAKSPPFVKIGRKVVYRVADLDDWASARVQGGVR